MSEPVTGPVLATQRYRDVTGALHTAALVPGEDVVLRGSTLPARWVSGPDGTTLLQKWVPAELGRTHPEAYDRLESEVRACAALGQRFGGVHYPPELPQLVGYNVDVAEPFVLLRPYRGDEVPTRRMELSVLRDFAAGLLRALQYTAASGVVHGDLKRTCVRWDGTTVQLVGFERAQRAGERRRPGGGDHRSPEQVAGQGPADPRDDVWGAGLLIHQLSLGPNAGDVRAPAAVQTLLNGVFVDTAAQRPTAGQMLQVLDPSVSPPEGSSPDELLAAGRAAFDEVLARKRGDVGSSPPGDTQTLRLFDDDTGSSVARNRTALVLAGLVALAVLVGVLVLVVR